MNTKTLKVLCIEDEEEIISLYSELLKDYVSSLDIGYSLKEAKEFVKKNSYDFLICDLRVGKDNGIDLIRFIRTEPTACSKTKIIMASGFLEPNQKDDLKSLKVDKILNKPFNPYELKDFIISSVYQETKESKSKDYTTFLKKKSILQLLPINRDATIIEGIIQTLGHRTERIESWESWDEDMVDTMNPEVIIMADNFIRGLSDPILKRIMTYKKANGIPLIVVITSYDREEASNQSNKFLEIGVDDFIFKPYKSLQIETNIKRYITIENLLQEELRGQRDLNYKFVHDINNFINLSYNALGSARRKFNKREPKTFDQIEALLQKAEAAIYQTSVLTYGILENFAILYDENKKVTKDFDLSVLIKGSIQKFIPFMDIKEQDIAMEFPKEKIINGSEPHLSVILDTLIGSSVKHSPKKALIELEITDDAIRIGNQTPGIYRDGKLVPSDIEIREFTEKEQNIGLGFDLNFCQSTLQKSGYDFYVKNKPNIGMDFYIVFKNPDKK